MLLLNPAAHAQAPAQPTTGFQDGFFIQSADGEHRLVFGLLTQVDGRFAVDDPLPITNTFTVRKLRPTLTGRVGRYFDFKLMPDFGGGQAVMTDAYVDVRFSRAFRLRTGKDKVPVGYEWLVGDAFLLFPERSLASSLVPLRDIGIQAQGDLAGGRVSYAGGVFNGLPDGANSATELDTNNSKDLAGRVVWRPAAGLGVQVGGSIGEQRGAVPSFRTSVSQTWFSYAAGTAASGSRRRVAPAVFYYRGPFGSFAEYVQSTQELALNGAALEATNRAWNVTASYVLTGEAGADRGVRPRAEFDPAEGRWGALQLVARYSALSVDDDVAARGFAAPGASGEARQWTLGLNWYPNPWIKWYGTFERTTFDEGAASQRPAEDVILFRFQLAF